jgi:hypothetical protein
MQSDEQIYELVAKELATTPRQGLLIKCMAKCEGDENKGKAMYIETRVDEIKAEIQRKAQQEAEESAKRQAELKEQRLKELQKENDEPAPVWFIGLVILFVCVIVVLVAEGAL